MVNINFYQTLKKLLNIKMKTVKIIFVFSFKCTYFSIGKRNKRAKKLFKIVYFSIFWLALFIEILIFIHGSIRNIINFRLGKKFKRYTFYKS